jgi:hypothetical protein
LKPKKDLLESIKSNSPSSMDDRDRVKISQFADMLEKIFILDTVIPHGI